MKKDKIKEQADESQMPMQGQGTTPVMNDGQPIHEMEVIPTMDQGVPVEKELDQAPPPETETKEVVRIELQSYIGSAILDAAPMNLGEYNKFRGWEIPADEDPLREGYLVRNRKSHTTWVPKEVFEGDYRTINEAALLPNGKVFPSDNSTIFAVPDADYGGAHRYLFQNSKGFKDGMAQYDTTISFIQFVQKDDDGSMIPGIQSEQLVLALMDRHNKLNTRFPSAFHAEGMAGLQMFLDAQRKRVEDRVLRGVMGDLKR